MNRCRVSVGVLSLLVALVSPIIVAADQLNGPQTHRKIPDPPPPPPPPPCPPAPPGIDIKPNCETLSLEDLRKQYLQSEGNARRGINFFHYATTFFGEHRFYKTQAEYQANYSFNTQALIKELGPPDYQKTRVVNNETVKQYAYAFDYKANKDYLIVLETVNNLVYRIGYTETVIEIDNSWEKYQ